MTNASEGTAVEESDLYLQRTKLLLGAEPVQALRGATVAIAGCGGVGGATAVLLARTGIGGFILADPGEFDPPDMNRQWGATYSTLGKKKVEVYEALIREINPRARIEIYREGITAENVNEVLSPADIVIDGLDLAVPLELRLAVYDRARRLGLHCLSSPIMGIATVMLNAAPTGMPLDGLICEIVRGLRDRAQLPVGFRRHLFAEHVDALENGVRCGSVPSIGIAPAFSAGFVSAEVLVVLLHKSQASWRLPISLPDVLVIEAMRPNTRIVSYTELFPELVGREQGGGRSGAA